MSAFWKFHEMFERQGPGEQADIDWAVSVAGTRSGARVCDAACGMGADIAGLKQAVPGAQITVLEKHAGFVMHVAEQFNGDADVTVLEGDMATLGGPFDLIWCAGAVYFLSIDVALRAWRDSLGPGGCVAFSEPCYFTDAPSEAATAFWDGEDAEIRTQVGIAADVHAAGYETLGTRALSDSAWEAYYTPMEAVIARIKPQAAPDMAEVIAMAEQEIAGWRAVRAQTGYLLSVVRPV